MANSTRLQPGSLLPTPRDEEKQEETVPSLSMALTVGFSGVFLF